jgi:alkylated DNA repair dioxygenase AlkB
MLPKDQTYQNLLPYDGTAIYYGAVIGKQQADEYFGKLDTGIRWQQDEVVIFGKKHITKRKTAWYGDDSLAYKYSGTTRTALPWTETLRELKLLVEQISAESYNSCLLNFYHDGTDGMSWHSDNEKMLKKNGAIASISLGAERKFSFKHKLTTETRSLILEHGSLLLMKDDTQQYWRHALPKSAKVKLPRINLTFRTIIA